MENELTTIEIRLIQSLLSKKSDLEIAQLLDKPVGLVSEKIAALSGINKKRSYKEIEQEKSALEIKVQQEKVLAKERIKKARSNKKKDQLIHKKLSEDYKKLKEARSKEKARQSQLAEHQKWKRTAPLCATKVIDYSQLIAVRIDHKTTVYAKPGDDPEEVRKRFEKITTGYNSNWKFKTGNNQ